jgi:hypothetical protein
MKAIFDRILLLLNGVALALVSLAFVDFLLHPLAGDFTYHSIFFRVVSMLVLTPLTLLVGFLIIRRVPGNVVGPLFILWSGTVAYGAIRKEIGLVAFTVFDFYEITIGWSALFLMVLHFPDGRIYPPGAAPWVYRLVGISFLLGIFIFLSSGFLQGGIANPFLIPPLQKLSEWVVWLSILIFSPALVLVLVSPVLRYRRGSRLERQQIKWLALFGGILFVYTILGFIVYPLITGGQMMSRENNLSSLLFFIFIGLFPPLAIGVAVLRYRLWDIDLLIRRTLVYSILTVILTLIYFGSVVSLQELSQLITSQHESPVVTVLSTLAIVALFTPLRRRIQERVDHRFYRQKYNADQVLANFSTTLREEVNLEQLTNSILEVAEATMQPVHLSLWLSQASSPKSRAAPGEHPAP